MLNLSNEKFKVAMYIRLSREDGDKQESESIGNQRLIIKRYLEENDLDFIDEYVDDGVSGTTFDRKEFNRLIQDIENKRINMVVTKDLSRLGRDYIKTGHYLENYFPEKNVRYVAILDGIDTHLDSVNNDITPFKAIMNDMYAKDISKKIRSVFKEKQKNGQFLGSIPAYGYQLSKEEKGKLVVDEYSAEIVKTIFKMYANGHGSIEIMNYLNKKKIETPSQYHRTKGKVSKEWNQITILSMLKNQVYIGNTVQNKKSKISYKSKKIRNNPKEKWIIVENTHQAIIDKNLFNNVKLMLEGRDTARFTKHEYLFKGLLKCYHCGRNLQIVLKNSEKKKAKNPYINCVGHEKRGKHPISMNYWEFEKNIIQSIKSICKIYLNDTIFEETYKNYMLDYFEILKDYHTQLLKMQDRMQEINSLHDKMYMDKLKGIIQEDDFIRYSTNFSKEKSEIENKIKEIEQKLEIMQTKREEKIDDEKIKKVITDFFEMKEIDKMLLYKLINRIEIDTKKNIYIYFNFNHLNIISDNLKVKDGRIEYEKIMTTG